LINQKQELPVAAMFVNESGQKEHSIHYRGSSIDAFYQISVHLGKRFIKIDYFVPIQWQTWPPQAILVSDWSISKNLLP
jgi:hypothetical protein